MSDDTRLYEVEVVASFTAWINVEAEDEDEAHDLAKTEARSLSTMEWTDDNSYEVIGIMELEA